MALFHLKNKASVIKKVLLQKQAAYYVIISFSIESEYV